MTNLHEMFKEKSEECDILLKKFSKESIITFVIIIVILIGSFFWAWLLFIAAILIAVDIMFLTPRRKSEIDKNLGFQKGLLYAMDLFIESSKEKE